MRNDVQVALRLWLTGCI